MAAAFSTTIAKERMGNCVSKDVNRVVKRATGIDVNNELKGVSEYLELWFFSLSESFDRGVVS